MHPLYDFQWIAPCKRKPECVPSIFFFIYTKTIFTLLSCLEGLARFGRLLCEQDGKHKHRIFNVHNDSNVLPLIATTSDLTHRRNYIDTNRWRRRHTHTHASTRSRSQNMQQNYNPHFDYRTPTQWDNTDFDTLVYAKTHWHTLAHTSTHLHTVTHTSNTRSISSPWRSRDSRLTRCYTDSATHTNSHTHTPCDNIVHTDGSHLTVD
jgi:hypothetical protein